ncbi:MAG: alpha-amylase family glycosyl hydrolase [Bacilli bacterium]
MFETFKNKIIYQIYVRNFTKEGTIKALIKKLPYIKSLGIDIIYLMPVFEIGVKDKKGSLGCPYSIKDYYKIDHNIGSNDDLKLLINETHNLGMEIIIDIVYNHTSRDSIILKEHPGWFLRDENDEIINKCPDWSDVYDLDYSNNELIEYLTKVLEYYVSIGIDGFRFDVASMIPEKFYRYAFPKLYKMNKNIILLGEAIEGSFLDYLRYKGFETLTDPLLYSCGFNLLYRYNSWPEFRDFLETKNLESLDRYKGIMSNEESLLPFDALRIGTIENHDNKRIASFSNSLFLTKNLLSYSFFLKGPAFIYCGEECKDTITPSLFEKEQINMEIKDQEYFNFVKTLIKIKKDPKNIDLISSHFLKTFGANIVVKNLYKDNSFVLGLFNFSEKEIIIQNNEIENGNYIDLISNKEFVINDNKIAFHFPLFLKKIN